MKTFNLTESMRPVVATSVTLVFFMIIFLLFLAKGITKTRALPPMSRHATRPSATITEIANRFPTTVVNDDYSTDSLPAYSDLLVDQSNSSLPLYEDAVKDMNALEKGIALSPYTPQAVAEQLTPEFEMREHSSSGKTAADSA